VNTWFIYGVQYQT